MKKILFISSGETITKMFVDVINKLKEYNHEVLVINQDYYYKDNSSEILRNEAIATRGLDTYKTKDARMILKLEKPNIIVVGHDGTAIEQSFIFSSKSLGIPSLLIQDGIINLPQILSFRKSISKFLHILPNLLPRLRITIQSYSFLLHTCGIARLLDVSAAMCKKSHAYGRGECSKVAVMSPYAKRVFVKLGFNADDVIITGQPRFDRLSHPKFKKSEVYEKINLSHDKDVALLATPTFSHSEMRSRFVEAVVDGFVSFSQFALVIKIHPRDDAERYKEILKEIKCANIRVVKGFEDVPSLINACTIFISHYSTMALEALIARKPVIILNLFNKPEYYPFVASGACLGVHKAEDLPMAIESIFYDEKTKRRLESCRGLFVYEHAYRSDGCASNRVATLIKEISKDCESGD